MPCRYPTTVSKARRSSIISFRKSAVKCSLITFISSSGSSWTSRGASPSSAASLMASHCLVSRPISAANSSDEACRAAVLTMTPKPFGLTLLITSRSRVLSASGRRLEIPMLSESGTNTRYRPGRDGMPVRRAPLAPIASLVTCTRTLSPSLRTSSMRLPFLPEEPPGTATSEA